jgi:hypothetical protein
MPRRRLAKAFIELRAALMGCHQAYRERVNFYQAALLDQRGSLRVRKAILSEARMAVDALRAFDNSLIGFGFDGRAPTDLLAAEAVRLQDLHAGRRKSRPRPALRIVGGTDMEGANGNAA